MLSGKNAVITGARKGIGFATVRVFAENGANVWACARSKNEEFEKKLQGIAETYGVWIKPVYFDITDENQTREAAQSIFREKEKIDILVNNAGEAEYAAFSMLSMKNLKKMFDTNYFSQMALTQLFLRRMSRNNSSSIIFLSSIAGLTAEDANLAYGGSKAAVAHATKILSRELAKQNIRVNAVAPGMVETDMKNKADPEYWEYLIQKTNLKRPAEPREIANVIAFLASDLSGYITGQIIRVDGGM